MQRLWKPLKKIGNLAGHIKSENIQNYQQFNLYCQDESRFGLMTMAHKALTIRGVKPVCNYQHKFENTYLFGAFSPVDGSHFMLEMPHCNADTFQIFLDDFSAVEKNEFKIMLLDNGAFHKAKKLKIPDNIALIFLPPYSPELNPAEKVWWVLKRELKMRTFKTIKEIQTALSDAIKRLITKEAMKQLTGFSYYQNIV